MLEKRENFRRHNFILLFLSKKSRAFWAKEKTKVHNLARGNEKVIKNGHEKPHYHTTEVIKYVLHSLLQKDAFKLHRAGEENLLWPLLLSGSRISPFMANLRTPALLK